MPTLKPIRILVVDDHFMVRMGLCASLNVEPDMEVVAEVGSGESAVAVWMMNLWLGTPWSWKLKSRLVDTIGLMNRD